MGYAAGYGVAITSLVQMAVMCYTGQNVVDRVSNFMFRNYFQCIGIFIRLFPLSNDLRRMIISLTSTTTSNGIFCQQMIKNMFYP